MGKKVWKGWQVRLGVKARARRTDIGTVIIRDSNYDTVELTANEARLLALRFKRERKD